MGLNFMAKKQDPDFYKKMQEAKRRKKKALEQKRIHDEFGDIPLPPQIVIKSEAEQRLDAAFNELKQKLNANRPLTDKERIEKAFNDIEHKAQGL